MEENNALELNPEIETPTEVQQEAKDLVRQAKNANFLRRLFPDEQQRKLAESQLKLVQTELEFQTKALVIAKNGMIQEMRNQVDAYTSVQGVKIHAWQEKEIRNLISIREKEVNEFIDTFKAEYEVATEKLNHMKEGKFKEFENSRLERVLVDTFQHLDYIKDKFDQALRFES